MNYKLNKLRVMALGYKDVKTEDYQKMIAEDSKDLELIEKHFVLLSLIVLDDPTRGPEVSVAVSDCKNAGINIKVVSGDSLEASKAVAKETGILCDFDEMCSTHVVLEGFEFRNKVGGIVTHSRKSRWGKDYVKNESAFREIIKDLKVLS